MQIPRPLRQGDLIAVTAPSAGVGPAMHGRLDAALAMLRARGYRVKVGQCLRNQVKGQSAPAEDRAAEFMEFLLDPQTSAVMPPWGGERAIELLPLIDFESLRSSPPKWLSGFSDISTLLLPLALKSGWTGLHAPNLMELAALPLDETTAAIWRFLEDPSPQQLQGPSLLHERGVRLDWSKEPQAGYALDTPTHWISHGTAAPQVLQGRLIGGCLDVLSRLAGTHWGDLRTWAAARNEPTLVFLENAELSPHEFHRALWSLRLHGWFEQASAILIGRHASPESAQDSFGFEQATMAALHGLNIPVITEMDIGHVPPQLSIWMGAWGRLEIKGSGTQIQLIQRRPTSDQE